MSAWTRLSALVPTLLLLAAAPLAASPAASPTPATEAAAPTPAATPGTERREVNLTLLSVNDLDRAGESRGRGGLARLAGALAAVRRENPNTLLFHAGDALSPSILSTFDNGKHMVEGLNRLDLAGFTPGNHEFDFGKDVFLQRLAEMRFPVLAANLRDAAGAPLPGVQDRRMLDVAGLKIGIYGVTTERSVTASSPGDLQFLPVQAAALEQQAALKAEGADLVIALAHTDFREDQALVRALAADVVLSGDDHNWVSFWNGEVVLAEAGAQGEAIQRIDLQIQVSTRDGRNTLTWTPRFTQIDSADVTPDAPMAAFVSGLEQQLDGRLGQPLGTLATPVDTRRTAVRGGEAAFGNLVADAIRQAHEAEIGLMNGGGIRAERVYASGTILTARDILTELPFNNRVVVLRVNGAQLKEVLEHGLGQMETLAGRFPQVSGVTMRIDPKRPAGSRILELQVGGAPLDLTRSYTLATNDYLARGGDAYRMLRDMPVVIGPTEGRLVAEEVIEMVRKAGTVAPKIEGRIAVQP